MSIPDTPIVTTQYCPTCEPDREGPLLEVRYCEPHTPDRGGAEDSSVQALAYLSGCADVTGDGGNRAWCELLHRKRRLLS
jgi:hypothetical protein